VSLPGARQESTPRRVIETQLQKDDLQLVNFMLYKLNERTWWPIQLFRPNEDEIEDISVLHHSYILFVLLEEKASLNETLENQVQNMKYSSSWNPRGRFVVVITGHNSEAPQLTATHICAILWQMSNIVNVVVLIPAQDTDPSLTAVTSRHRGEPDTLNLYSWFPYQLGRCVVVQDADLQDKWVLEHNGRFSKNVNLFPQSVPKNLMGCSIRVGTIGPEPHVILTDNYTRNDGSIAHKLTGLSLEIFHLVCENMNLTMTFFPPSLSIEEDSYFRVMADLQVGISDVLTGSVPLIPLFLASSYDPTITYTYVDLRMLIPCPKPIPGMEKIMPTFSLSVWLTKGLVFLLTAVVFWFVTNGPYQPMFKELHSYKSVTYEAWAVYMGVSVTQLPTTSKLRVFFFIYVCYCFAMSTVFQAFFVSYLVEPDYEKKIETLHDLLNPDTTLGYHSAVQVGMHTASYPEFMEFCDRKEPKEGFTESRKCIERLVTNRDIASLFATLYSSYVASEMVIADPSCVLCSLDERVIARGLTVLFRQGSPFLDTFNVLMKRSLVTTEVSSLLKK
jgi:hypothetical protein